MRGLDNDLFGAGKVFRHLDRLAAWQRDELPAPVTVEIDLTNLCNHSCGGCTFGYLVNKSRDELPLDLAQRLIGEFASLGVRAVTFSGGGEPLVYGEGRVLDLMGLARALGMDVALITNGSLLTPDPRYFAALEWVRVSLDAYDAATFSRFHGRGAREFAKVVERLHGFCSEAQRRRDAGLRAPTVGVGFLTDHGSLVRGDLWRMADFCAGIVGLDYLQFRPLVQNMVADPSLTGGYERPIDLTVWREAYEEAATYARPGFRVLWSEGKYDALASPGYGKTYARCHAHFLEAVVGADSRVYVCCHGQGQDGFCLGDLREQSFADIWHGERARRVWESISPRDTCPPACRLHLQNLTLDKLARHQPHENFI